MENTTPPVKAYKNMDFLTSPSARSIRMLSEFYEPQYRFRKNNILDTIVFFGSARIMSREEAESNLKKIKSEYEKDPAGNEQQLKNAEKMLEISHYYESAAELAGRLTKWSMSLETEHKRFIVCSGGGPGIMEAANKGAAEAGGFSVGLNISLPFEQFVNKYVKPDHAFEFHYFFMRKFWFVYLAKALIVFPGGFGTLDELMEVLTLQQTGKIKKNMKIIVFGKDYWQKVINFDALVEFGTISREDLDLFDFCDTVDEAYEKITDHFIKNYLQ